MPCPTDCSIIVYEKSPAYPWSRTLTYILILSILLLISLWSIPAAMFGLISFNVIVLIIGRYLEI
ncbi:hypothetical protein [Streptococcus suis]|uniref:hypothetical protein n=1 Tax=Streptococcus suis TaxID=1307 RepID=UPI00129007D8|nr:hypothetical protein [Streptococcus suis]MBM0195561.1 hypothetical protein [Streptococcus suis]MBM7316983.1 hypothetical protein [Streptococcus suis]HEM4695844.1 hypothetical protein [Streptococcus suis]HEM4859453.1 hypothetical protein [Streptococcus suis]HEM5028810.1 hypothetical protein [Streptococcus suis]